MTDTPEMIAMARAIPDLPPDQETRAERIFYHGRMAFWCSALIMLPSVALSTIWPPAIFAGIAAGGAIGVHLGQLLVELARDTDRNLEGEDPQGLRAEHESGGRNGIAQDQSAIINHIAGKGA